MQIREKIIVALAGLAILYALFVYLFTGGPARDTAAEARALTDLTGFVAQASQSVAKSEPAKTEWHVIASALTPWPQDPFLVTVLKPAAELPGETKPAATAIPLVYSGYLMTKGHKLAIINNMEYAEGEAMIQPGHTVRTITPDHVVISVLGRANPLVLPLAEIK